MNQQKLTTIIRKWDFATMPFGVLITADRSLSSDVVAEALPKLFLSFGLQITESSLRVVSGGRRGDKTIEIEFDNLEAAKAVCAKQKGNAFQCVLSFTPLWAAPESPSPSGMKRAARDLRRQGAATICKSTQKYSVGEDKTAAEPYSHVPIPESVRDKMAAEPFSHGLMKKESLSGELRLSFEALTPFLCANEQYAYSDASEEVQQACNHVVASRHPTDLDRRKKILEPLMLPSRAGKGAVVVPSRQMKGMLRQSLSALLASPMERVWERTFSDRMVLQAADLRSNHAALVVAGGGWKDNGRPNSVRVVYVPLQNIYYWRSDIQEHFPNRLKQILADEPGWRAIVADLTTWGRGNKLEVDLSDIGTCAAGDLELSQSRIIRKGLINNSMHSLVGTIAIRNLNGIDLDGQFHAEYYRRNAAAGRAAENASKSPQGYPYLLIKPPNPNPVSIDGETLTQFYRSLEHLSDRMHGHLKDHPLLHGEAGATLREGAIRRVDTLLQRGLQPGDILFLERTRNGNSLEVSQIGHALRARGRSRDTVHTSADRELHQSLNDSGARFLRRVLCPLPEERITGISGPQKLSLTRRLFGYVSTKDGQYSPSEPLTFGIGFEKDKVTKAAYRTDFAQVAGRLSFNFAVEEIVSTESSRFLSDNIHDKCLIPLRALGSPKPSAVANYLDQKPERIARRSDGGILSTYGDTEDDPSAGNLRGRKFYLHQPNARQADNKGRSCYELLTPNQLTEAWRKQETRDMIGNLQSVFARFVSVPGSRFRVSLRFHELEKWEMGAVFLCLVPTSKNWAEFATNLKAKTDAAQLIIDWLNGFKGYESETAPLLAAKLGHARPLGFGSVKMAAEQLFYIETKDGVPPLWNPIAIETEMTCMVRAFADFLLERLGNVEIESWIKEVCLPWLQIHRYAGRTRYDYKRELAANGLLPTIFDYHTNLKTKHGKGRKLARNSSMPIDTYGVASLDRLDAEDLERLGRRPR